jgi:hypothetical protein
VGQVGLVSTKIAKWRVVAMKSIKLSVISAQAGWEIVSLDAGDKHLYRTPVIAWLIEIIEKKQSDEVFPSVTPITAIGDAGDGEYALQFSKSGPLITYSEDFSDEEALMAHFRKTSAKSG